MTGVDIDARDLSYLGNELGLAGFRVGVGVRASIAKGAHQVKEGWANNARQSAGAHAARYPDSITYDIEGTGFSAVIGPDKARPQGALGNLLEYGSSKNPPHDDGGRALLEEQARLEAAIAEVAANGVLGAAR